MYLVVTGTTNASQNGTGSNEDVGILYTLQSSKTKDPAPDVVYCHAKDINSSAYTPGIF